MLYRSIFKKTAEIDKTIDPNKKLKHCASEAYQKLYQQKKEQTKVKLGSTGNLVKLIILGILILLFAICYQKTSQFEQIQTFDPFEILEIDHSAETGDIKKAFRRLSLRWHPDKNRDNPLPAAAKFL